MQKITVLNKKKLDKAQHLLKLGTGIINLRGTCGLEKHPTFEFSLLMFLDVLRIFKNRYF